MIFLSLSPEETEYAIMFYRERAFQKGSIQEMSGYNIFIMK